MYHDNWNIAPCKYWFRLLIFQINYSIDNIDYRTALAKTRDAHQGVSPEAHIWSRHSWLQFLNLFCCKLSRNRIQNAGNIINYDTTPYLHQFPFSWYDIVMHAIPFPLGLIDLGNEAKVTTEGKEVESTNAYIAAVWVLTLCTCWICCMAAWIKGGEKKKKNCLMCKQVISACGVFDSCRTSWLGILESHAWLFMLMPVRPLYDQLKRKRVTWIKNYIFCGANIWPTRHFSANAAAWKTTFGQL
jgi:hypothetical protein